MLWQLEDYEQALTSAERAIALDAEAQKVGQHLNLLALGDEAAEATGLSAEAIEAIQTEGLRAKKLMIQANLRLVAAIAKKYQNRGLELSDLIQEGSLGLVRAVEKFDPTKGYRFSTYAYRCIQSAIKRAIATQSRTIRLPVSMTQKLSQIKQAQHHIAQKKGRTARLKEIACELKMTTDEVREVLQKATHTVSLNTKMGQDGDAELGDLLEAKDGSPDEQLMCTSLKHDLKQLISKLNPRQQEVITLRFGLDDGVPYTLTDIGHRLQLSRKRVRSIEADALLRTCLKRLQVRLQG